MKEMKKKFLLNSIFQDDGHLHKSQIPVSVYRVRKINASLGDVWFFNPKNVTIGSSVDQYKKSPSFWPIGEEMLILHENLELLMAKENFPLKKGNFWAIGQKDGDGQSQW